MKGATVALAVSAGLVFSGAMRPESCLYPKRMVGLKYPRMAHYAGAEGKVELEALVSSDGTVKSVASVSGPRLLADWMNIALMEWRFTGCTTNEAPCKYRVTFIFERLTGTCWLPNCPNVVEIDLPVITIRSQQAHAAID